jgi:hypothetical protein
MSVSVRTRFEVFKRDRFTCSYCGRTPPEVLLEADHIVPRAAGGSDDITNLTTACATCNSGKAARLLEEGTAPVVGKATVEQLAERLEQAKAYMEVLGGMSALIDRQYNMVLDEWAKAFGATVEERADGAYWVFADYGGYGLFPNEHSVKRFLKHMSFEGVLDAISIAASRMDSRPSKGATLYFYGVCNRSIKEGREPGSGPAQTAGTTDEDIFEAMDRGQRIENDRLRRLFLDYQGHGYATVQELIAALWSPD